jgi:gliding motility-associated-like protein
MTVLPSLTPAANITLSQNNFCFGKSVTFTAHATNVGPTPTYHWEVNGNSISDNDSVFTSNTLNNDNVVSCVVDVSSGLGCYTLQSVTSNTITVIVYPIPVITFSPDTIIIARYDFAKINTSVIGNIQSFSWTPTNGLIDPLSLTPVADPVVSTVYQLSVISVNNCRGTSNVTILVYDKIFMPSAFAPAGKNNIFRVPPTITFNLDNFSIYDRWGNKVFMTTDISKGWDGTVEGVNADRGVYVYVISGSDPHGKVFVKGTVTLLR